MVTNLKIETQVWDDQDWALQHYPELVAKYASQWIAVYNRHVIAAGHDLAEVEEQAAIKTGQAKEKIAVLYVEAGNQIF